MSLLAAALVLSTASPAMAQGDDGGEEVTLDDMSGELGGADENPDAPKLIGDEEEKQAAAVAAADDGPYPIEVARRPITLHAGMSEAELQVPVTFDPLVLSAAVRVSYGVTREAQLGLRYGAGALADGEFVTGKAVAIDFIYLVQPWVAAQLTLPVLLDPFAMGVRLGAPMKFRFEKFSLFAGRDLLGIKIKRFIPEIEIAADNAGAILLDASNTKVHDADLRFLGGVIYQLEPHIALTGEAGLVVQIGASAALDNSALQMSGTVTYSRSNMLDLGARLFVRNFDEVGKTAGLAVFAALRI
ncbi:MAG TPA: hypothetical protein VML75_06215 [Kofleriaceae bacterium]|nr:hypothetical protein [Kofleriaceae bacterium]